jgi:hypothetical protein
MINSLNPLFNPSGLERGFKGEFITSAGFRGELNP